jgi:hypothetical protein
LLVALVDGLLLALVVEGGDRREALVRAGRDLATVLAELPRRPSAA